MPIALDATSNNGTSSGSKTWDHTIGSGSDRILLVIVHIEQTSPNISAATYNGQSMTLAVSDTESVNQSAIFYLLDADLPAAGTYTVAITTNESNADNDLAAAISLTGVKQAAPEDTASQTATSGTGLSTSITPTAGAWVVESYQSSNPGVTLNPTSDQTEWRDNAARGSISVAESYEYHATGGATNESWSCSSSSTRQIHLLVSLAIAGIAVAASSLAPFEALATTTTTTTPGVESLAQPRATPTLVIEATASVEQAQSLPVEALRELIAAHHLATEAKTECRQPGALTLESLATLTRSPTVAYEATQSTSSPYQLPTEALARLTRDFTAPHEALTLTARTAALGIEALRTTTGLVIVPWESDGVLLINAAIGLTFEALGALAQPATVTTEALGRVAAGRLLPYSALATTEANQTSGYEALGFSVTATASAFEALQWRAALSDISLETLQTLRADADVTIEALHQASNALALPFETHGRLVVITPAALEALQQTQHLSSAHYEALHSLSSAATLPFEFLPHLITPLVRKLSIDDETRLIYVSRETRLLRISGPRH